MKTILKCLHFLKNNHIKLFKGKMVFLEGKNLLVFSNNVF